MLAGRSDEKVTWRDIDQVLLVGGGARVPAVKEEIAKRIQAASKRFTTEVTLVEKPQHQVGFGAARVATELAKSPDLFNRLHVRIPHSIGHWFYPNGDVDTDRQFGKLIPRNTRVPLPSPAAFTIPVGGGDGRSCYLDIVEQKIGLTKYTNEPNVSHETIASVSIPGEVRSSTDHQEKLQLRFSYFSDRDMKFRAKYRGKRVRVTIRGKEVTLDDDNT